MTPRSPESEVRRPFRLATLALLLLVAATAGACTWFTGEFSALDRPPPSADRDGPPAERP